MWGAGDFTLWATMQTPPGAALPGGSPVCDAAEPHNALGLRPEAQVNEFTETGSPTQAGLLSLSLFGGPSLPQTPLSISKVSSRRQSAWVPDREARETSVTSAASVCTCWEMGLGVPTPRGAAGRGCASC